MSLSTFKNLEDHCDLDWAWLASGFKDGFIRHTTIGQLMALQKLKLWRCYKLKQLPTSIGQLMALQKLNFLECSELELLTSISQ